MPPKLSIQRSTTPTKPTPTQIAKARLKREQILEQMRKEKRWMLLGSFIAFLGGVAWVGVVVVGGWHTSNLNGTEIVGGLWRRCVNGNCQPHPLLSPPKDQLDVTGYRRTSLIFALISLLLMAFSLTSSFYTFKNARYIYKRLAAGLFFLSAGCVLIVLESVAEGVRLEMGINEEWSFGWGWWGGWIIFSIYLINFAVYICYSRKKKTFYEGD